MITVVLLLLTATLLAHGALVMARAELSAARAHARALGDESALRARMDEALATGLDPTFARLPVWGVAAVRDSVGGTPRPLRLRRLGPESWWLEQGGEDSRRRVGTPGRLLWWLDPVTRVRSLGAVVIVGPDARVLVDGTLERSSFGWADPPLDAAACAAEIGTAFDGVVPDALAVAPDASSPTLGLLAFEELLAATTVDVVGTGEPSATEWAGECSTGEPWNWGAPDRVAAPCGSHIAVRRSADTLRVTGGTGQAMLVIDGDLILSGDARVYGMIVASGVVALDDRSELHGVVLAGGGLTVAAGATVHGSACWAARALRAGMTEWMPSPVPVPGVPPVTP